MEYDLLYATVKSWAKTQLFISHSSLQIRFNLRYAVSKELIERLQREMVITMFSNSNGYKVLQQNSRPA